MYGDYAVAEPRIRGRVPPPPQLGVAPVVVAAAGSIASRLFSKAPRDPSRDVDEVNEGLRKLATEGDRESVRLAATGGVVPAIPQRDGGTWVNVNFAETSAGRMAERRYAQQLLAEMDALQAPLVTASVVDITDRTRPGGVAAPLPGGVPPLPGTAAVAPAGGAPLMRAGLSGTTALLGAAGLLGAALMMRQAKPRRNPSRRRGRRRGRRRR